MATRALDPATFALLPNFPNPFNPTTTIPFALPAASHVHLSVYSVLGQEVAVSVDGVLEEGYRTVVFDAHNLSSGTYYVRMNAEAVGSKQTFVATRIMVLIK
jgi:hypothetical protein